MYAIKFVFYGVYFELYGVLFPDCAVFMNIFWKFKWLVNPTLDKLLYDTCLQQRVSWQQQTITLTCHPVDSSAQHLLLAVAIGNEEIHLSKWLCYQANKGTGEYCCEVVQYLVGPPISRNTLDEVSFQVKQ